MTWFRDRILHHFGPPKKHLKSTQNHVKSMLRPILGQDGSNKRYSIDFASNFHWFLIDFDVIVVRYSNHVALNFHSIWDWLRDAFCNRIRYSFKLLPFGVHRTIIPVNSDSMKTTAARGTANGQPPFHSSLSYCGLVLSVSSSPRTMLRSISHTLGPNATCTLQLNTVRCQAVVFICAKNNHTCEQWQHGNNRSTGHRYTFCF